MQSEEQQLIDGLFDRLKTAETQSGPRDVTVETHINQRLSTQPAAPYYMAQAIIVQEAALKQLDQRINALQAEIARLQQPTTGRGSFLAGLFGAGRTPPSSPATENVWERPATTPGSAPIPGVTPYQGQAASPPPFGSQNPPLAQGSVPSRTSHFLGGALQTAAGVAGGVVLADMLTGMFRHNQPEEIINIITDTPQEVGHEPWRDNDATLRDTTYDNDDDFSGDAFSDSNFSDDDDYT